MKSLIKSIAINANNELLFIRYNNYNAIKSPGWIVSTNMCIAHENKLNKWNSVELVVVWEIKYSVLCHLQRNCSYSKLLKMNRPPTFKWLLSMGLGTWFHCLFFNADNEIFDWVDFNLDRLRKIISKNIFALLCFFAIYWPNKYVSSKQCQNNITSIRIHAHIV